MSEMLLPVSIYLTDSILSGIYTQGFLQEKYRKRVVWAAWVAAYFFIRIAVFEILDSRFPVSEVAGIILNVCVMLFMQLLLYTKDMQKQIFVAFSFVAGKEIVKYIASVFSFIFAGLWNKTFDFLLAKRMLNTVDKMYFWGDISTIATVIIGTLFHALLLSIYLFVIRREFVKKAYPLQTHEKVAERREEKKAAEEARTETGEYTVSATGTDIKAVTQKVIAAFVGMTAPTGASFDLLVVLYWQYGACFCNVQLLPPNVRIQHSDFLSLDFDR